MTREEIDAIYDAQQNTNTVNNTGITREEIDAIFDGVANANKAQNMKSIQPTNASVSSPVIDDQNIIDMNGNVTKAKVKKQESKHEPYYYNNFQQIKMANDAKKEIESKKQSAFARNNFQKTNELLANDGLGKSKEERKLNTLKIELSDIENNPSLKNNPYLKNTYQRAIDKQEKIENQTLVSDNANNEEISSALAKWASPGYKMTSEEKKNARKLYGNGIKEGIDRNTLSDEDKNNLSLAYSKSNPLQNFMLGLGDNPVFNAFSNNYEKYGDMPETNGPSVDQMTENAYTQQPLVTSGGKLAGSMAEYAIGSKVIGALPGIGSATQKAGQAIGKGAEKTLGTLGIGMADAGSKGVANLGTKLLSGGAQRAGQAIGNSASNIIGDSLVDVALDTVPNALNDAKSGANGKEVGINAAKNLAANIGFNAVGEAAQVIPYLGMNMKNYGRNDKAYSEAMDNIAKRNPLNPLEDTVAKSSDDIEKGNIIPMVNADDSAHAITSDNASDIASFNYSISNSAEKVNTPITDYKKVKINNHDDFKLLGKERVQKKFLI